MRLRAGLWSLHSIPARYVPVTKVLVTGGAGYKGCILVPKLLNAGYAVVVYDLMLYGDKGLPQHRNLRVIQADIRDRAAFAQAVKGAEAVIHLACISNDPSFELDPALSRSINYDCFEPMVESSRAAGVRRFIYASSSSVYGVSEAPEVTEEHPLVPLTDYNKDRKSTRLNSSHIQKSRMPSSA